MPVIIDITQDLRYQAGFKKGFKEGFEKGFKKGLEKARQLFVKNLLEKTNHTVSEIASLTDVSEAFIRSVGRKMQPAKDTMFLHK